MITKKQLGDNLRHYRNKAGLSQMELSFELECEQCSVSEWETGKHWPRLETVLKLCEIFCCTPDDLLLDS